MDGSVVTSKINRAENLVTWQQFLHFIKIKSHTHYTGGDNSLTRSCGSDISMIIIVFVHSWSISQMQS